LNEIVHKFNDVTSHWSDKMISVIGLILPFAPMIQRLNHNEMSECTNRARFANLNPWLRSQESQRMRECWRPIISDKGSGIHILATVLIPLCQSVHTKVFDVNHSIHRQASVNTPIAVGVQDETSDGRFSEIALNFSISL
jgi:hypothetical protein